MTASAQPPMIMYDLIAPTNARFIDDTVGTDPPTGWTRNSVNTSNVAAVAADVYDIGSNFTMGRVDVYTQSGGDAGFNITTDVSQGSYWNRVYGVSGMLKNLDAAVQPAYPPIFYEMDTGTINDTSPDATIYDAYDNLGVTSMPAASTWSGFNTTLSFPSGDSLRMVLPSGQTGFGGQAYSNLFIGGLFDLQYLVEDISFSQIDRNVFNYGAGTYESIELADPVGQVDLTLGRITPNSQAEGDLFNFLNAVRRKKPFAFWLDRNDFTNQGRHFRTCYMQGVSGIREQGGARGYRARLQFVAPVEWSFQLNTRT